MILHHAEAQTLPDLLTIVFAMSTDDGVVINNQPFSYDQAWLLVIAMWRKQNKKVLTEALPDWVSQYQGAYSVGELVPILVAADKVVVYKILLRSMVMDVAVEQHQLLKSAEAELQLLAQGESEWLS
jgi:hypothetical protein